MRSICGCALGRPRQRHHCPSPGAACQVHAKFSLSGKPFFFFALVPESYGRPALGLGLVLQWSKLMGVPPK